MPSLSISERIMQDPEALQGFPDCKKLMNLKLLVSGSENAALSPALSRLS